jgi:SAM-dependent methyltransferase
MISRIDRDGCDVGWVSYEGVAAAYEECAARWFAPLAAALVERLRPGLPVCVLDVGTGTGLVAGHVRDRLGSDVVVVGADPSADMLRLASRAAKSCLVRAGLPWLPVRGSAFDAVTANLVMSHVPALDAAATEMRRCARRGGMLACTSWAPNEPAPAGHQRPRIEDIVGEVAESLSLPDPPCRATPHEEVLREPDVWRRILVGAGFADVVVDDFVVDQILPLERFAATWDGVSRYRRSAVDASVWSEFRRRVDSRLTDEFGGTFRSIDRFWIATATAA